MPFFCYIYRRDRGVPYFEVLADATELGAVNHAADLLAQRVDAIRAEIWDGETLVFTLPTATRAARAAASDPPEPDPQGV